jgi:hypothetical protein
VGVARLVSVAPAHVLRPQISVDEFNLGNYAQGRFGWVLADPHMLPEPYPCRGHQKLWRLTPIQTDMIHALLRLAGTAV